jgi:hypothetical protein
MTTEMMIAALGVYVAALGVLFAAGAIAVAFVLFRQSREYRDQVAKSVADYRALLDEYIAEKDKQIALTIDTEIARLQPALKEAQGVVRDEIIRQIEDLAKLKQRSAKRGGQWSDWSDTVGFTIRGPQDRIDV